MAESKTTVERLVERTYLIITFVAAVIPVIIALKFDSFESIFLQKNAFNSLTVILLSIVSASVYLLTRHHYEKRENKLIDQLKTEQEDNRRNRLLLDNSKRLLYDINIERHTDVITGIPNQTMFRQDVIRITESIQHGEIYQIILIDIDNFGSINKEYGYFKGDELIRSIASELYYSMRRNESIYKTKFISNDEPLTENVYRKYNGGDEFIILIKGIQDEAVGFLTRLHRQLRIFSEKTVEIIPKKFVIDFHAGIAPLYANDEPDLALSRVEECFRIAKREDSPLKVKWFKEPAGTENAAIYSNAIIEFAKSK
jgi:GGDEF domain-containing protein